MKAYPCFCRSTSLELGKVSLYWQLRKEPRPRISGLECVHGARPWFARRYSQIHLTRASLPEPWPRTYVPAVRYPWSKIRGNGRMALDLESTSHNPTNQPQ